MGLSTFKQTSLEQLADLFEQGEIGETQDFGIISFTNVEKDGEKFVAINTHCGEVSGYIQLN